MEEFKGKVALVTGAASGIGRSTAQLFADRGARVVVSDLDDEGARETVDLIRRSGGEAEFVHTDVASAAECEALVQYTLDTFGRLDFACNNAGIGGDLSPTGEYSIDNWQKTIGVNLSGVFYCTRYEIPAMLKTGGGSIVNMASILGQVAFQGAPAYVAAKHGVVGLTKTAAVDHGTQGIRVNAVGPAFIRTPMIQDLESDESAHAALVASHPIGRLGEPEEVAELVVWLCSDQASFVTGAYYPIDGGYLAR